MCFQNKQFSFSCLVESTVTNQYDTREVLMIFNNFVENIAYSQMSKDGSYNASIYYSELKIELV